jgi:hypothetical protein
MPEFTKLKRFVVAEEADGEIISAHDTQEWAVEMWNRSRRREFLVVGEVRYYTHGFSQKIGKDLERKRGTD